VSAVNLKIRRPSSGLDGMPVVNTTSPAWEVVGLSPAWEVVGFNICAGNAKHLSSILAIKGSFFILFEEH
jgi:hypothetical protein